MYTPTRFHVTDRAELHQFIENHSFATLISSGDETDQSSFEATHLPLLLRREDGPFGHLYGHVAKANPQWEHADGQRCLAIFSGPHAYISPSWYGEQDVVPTWNYVAVHVHGIFHVETDRSTCLQVLRDTVERFEANQRTPWSIDQTSNGYIDQLAEAIVCFRIEIERIEGNWKLNQHHPSDKRAKIANALRATGGDNQTAIADAMVETLDD